MGVVIIAAVVVAMFAAAVAGLRQARRALCPPPPKHRVAVFPLPCVMCDDTGIIPGPDLRDPNYELWGRDPDRICSCAAGKARVLVGPGLTRRTDLPGRAIIERWDRNDDGSYTRNVKFEQTCGPVPCPPIEEVELPDTLIATSSDWAKVDDAGWPVVPAEPASWQSRNAMTPEQAQRLDREREITRKAQLRLACPECGAVPTPAPRIADRPIVLHADGCTRNQWDGRE